MGRWLDVFLKKPVAVLAAYDPQGAGGDMDAIVLGLRVPDDVAIVGVGNEELQCRLSARHSLERGTGHGANWLRVRRNLTATI